MEELVNRVLNDKTASNNNNIAYGYYPKYLKEYGSDLLWINQKMAENQLIDFENKGASASVTASVLTKNPVSEYVPTNYPVSDSNVVSRNKGVLPKVIKNYDKRGTKISVDNAKNEIAAIVYKKKT